MKTSFLSNKTHVAAAYSFLYVFPLITRFYHYHEDAVRNMTSTKTE